jgi:glycosyltransferase involved in cell wall biosynthesis
MPIAILHDWLNQIGGAEDVLDVLHDLFPQAPVFTSIYDRARMPERWRRWDIRSTWLDRMPAIHRRHQPYMPLFAAAWARYRIPAEFDLLLSNKSAFCIGARGDNPAARHVCYCLTPTRFTYDFESYRARERIPAAAVPVLKLINAALRAWETKAAQRVHMFLAISREVQQRIRTLYGRESEILYPPVGMPAEPPSETRENFFLIASRLLPYKRIDLAIEACAALGARLVVTGDGRDRPRLEALAAATPGADVRFLGRVDDDTLTHLLRTCNAFLFPGFEDFGIAPVRAMAHGKPVVAFARGGALDTVVDGESGVLFHEQSHEALIAALEKVRVVTFFPSAVRRQAERFGTDRFAAGLHDALRRARA